MFCVIGIRHQDYFVLSVSAFAGLGRRRPKLNRAAAIPGHVKRYNLPLTLQYCLWRPRISFLDLFCGACHLEQSAFACQELSLCSRPAITALEHLNSEGMQNHFLWQ
jgi:hypothetical protein